jgi:hypothetical protein
MKKMLLGFLMFQLMAGTAHALTLTTYTDFAAWNAAAGTSTLEDFNDENLGPFTTRDFGDFTATLYNQRNNYTPSITEKIWRLELRKELRLPQLDSDSYTQLLFESPITALGFDWRNTDDSYDDIEMNISGQIFEFGEAWHYGFYGVVATSGTFDAIDFGYTATGNYDDLQFGYIDNIRYHTVPEPTTLFLFGLGLLGLAGENRRKQ